MENTFLNKNVLITGGTGSFGNKMAKMLIEKNPNKIIIFSRDEKKQYEMKKKFPDFNFIIGDIRDKQSLKNATKNVDYIFHAAALKHVPSCEDIPLEAIKTNVLGTSNLLECAILNSVRNVICLSTDKSVKPVNTMGMTKALMEKIAISYNKKEDFYHDTIISCVRYGNVMASRGSVIPFFKERIMSGKKIKITVPEMTRFMLTLEDACKLVFYAFENSVGGEIFVKKSPACTIKFLSYFMQMYYNINVGEEIVGTRPGEKIHEILINEYEYTRSVENDDFFIIKPEYDNFIKKEYYEQGYEYSSNNTRIIEKYEDFLEMYKKIDNEDLI